MMLAGMLAFLSGIFCLLQLSTLPDKGIVLLLPLLFILGRYHYSGRLALLFCIGFCYALISLEGRLQQLPDALVNGNPVYISGTVASLPEIYPGHVRFNFRLRQFKDNTNLIHKNTELIRLSWYNTEQIPVPGESWQFKVKLKRPHGFMNPGGFDYEAWLFRKNIRLSAYVKEDVFNKRIQNTAAYFIPRIRHTILLKLNALLPDSLTGFAVALSLGERSYLSTEEWKVLTKTGTNHLIAISGLHLALVAGFVFFMARFVFRHFYFITLYVPAPLLASASAFIAAFVYAMLAGFSLPTQRALIMLGAFLLAFFSDKKIAISNVIAIAIVLILLLQPLALIAVDFWLSFGAVIIILYLTRFRKSTESKLLQWSRLQFFLSLALFPFLIFWFKQIPVYSVIANLIAIPLVGFVLLPLLLMGLLFLFILPQVSLFLYQIAEKVNAFYWYYLSNIAAQPNSTVAIAMPTTLSLLLALIGMAVLFMPKGLPGRYLGLIWLTPLLFPAIPKPDENEFDFTLLDVGQGLAAVIQTNQHVLIYDTGAKFSERFNIGDAVIRPYLKYKGVNQISILLVSHGDNDHIGGAQALLENFAVNKILSSVPEKFPGRSVESCLAGQRWEWDGVGFEILHPRIRTKGNNGSCVLKVSSQFGSVLLTGDIEKQAEKSLLVNSADKLHADILVVPHHGSKTSSTFPFIKQVNPKYAFFPTAYKNRFGFPKQAILLRYDQLGISKRISYESGALSVKFRQNGITLGEYRKENRRLWHNRID